ncbi:MAG: ABC transporter substrate-binding protein [Thermodesulfobacteriota bacterium]|nr:ABC transporter substrate-binding protein [Thermodesulfobacteriota bacterium]
MKKSTIRRCITCLLLLLLATGAAFAEEGVTDTEIHIGGFGPLTGPAKPWSGFVMGPELVFEMANEKGGIHGRKIIYHYFDDSYNPAKTRAGVKRLQESQHIFAWVGGVGTSCCLAVKDYLMAKGAPWIGPYSGAESWTHPPQKTIFMMAPLYTTEASVLTRYAVEEMGRKKVAIVYQNDGFGKSGLTGAQKALAGHNTDLVAAIPVEPTSSNMKPVVTQLYEAEADTVLFWLTPFSALRIIVLANKMNYTPQWMAGSTLSAFDQLYPLSKGLIKGMITTNYLRFDDPELINYYKTEMMRLTPQHGGWNIPYAAGVGNGDMLVMALKKAGRDLTREKLIEALESIQDVQRLGPVMSFGKFNPDDPACRQINNVVYIQKCLEGGKAERLTGWLSDN